MRAPFPLAPTTDGDVSCHAALDARRRRRSTTIPAAATPSTGTTTPAMARSRTTCSNDIAKCLLPVFVSCLACDDVPEAANNKRATSD
eukprot:3485178-Prorocentrum_lima.AAC.1